MQSHGLELIESSLAIDPFLQFNVQNKWLKMIFNTCGCQFRSLKLFYDQFSTCYIACEKFPYCYEFHYCCQPKPDDLSYGSLLGRSQQKIYNTYYWFYTA